MALNPGDIMFTSNLMDATHPYYDSFSFIATTSISAGEVIRFYDGTGDYFEFTVGSGGLAALDRVTLAENSSGTIDVLEGNGTAGSVTNPLSWNVGPNDAIIAASGNEVIAAICNSSSTGYSNTLAAAQGVNSSLTDTNAQATSNPSPILEQIETTDSDDNVMYAGTTIEGIDNFANWVGTDTAQDHTAPNISGTTYATQDATITCFAAGTLIATPSGEVTVESLRIGDRILTAQGRAVPVKWIGRQNVMTRFAPAERLMPVRFTAGALGDGLPHSDLTVTTDHAMLVDGVLIHAGALVNGTTITRVPLSDMGERFTVYHIETVEHEIILANGAPAETFIDNVSRRVFDNYEEFEALYGDVPEMEELDYPRAMSARQVPPAIKARLDIRRLTQALPF